MELHSYHATTFENYLLEGGHRLKWISKSCGKNAQISRKTLNGAIVPIIPAKEKDSAASVSIITGKTANCRPATFLIPWKRPMTAQSDGLYKPESKLITEERSWGVLISRLSIPKSKP